MTSTVINEFHIFFPELDDMIAVLCSKHQKDLLTKKEARDKQVIAIFGLTHWGLLMPYGDIDLGQHWLRLWLDAFRHQAITWTNVDLLSEVSCGNHLN